MMDVGRWYTNIPIRVKNISTEKWPAFGTSDGRYRVAVDSGGSIIMVILCRKRAGRHCQKI